MEKRIENEEQENRGEGKGQMDRKQGQEGNGGMDGGKDRKRETGKWETGKDRLIGNREKREM